VLVAPSLTEGFGLPVAEGLLAGCRVVCSDIPAHREIAEGQCRFVNLRDKPAETLAAVVADAFNQPKRRPILLPRFSAPVLAPQYLSIYSRLIHSAAPEQATTAASSIGLLASERQPL